MQAFSTPHQKDELMKEIQESAVDAADPAPVRLLPQGPSSKYTYQPCV